MSMPGWSLFTFFWLTGSHRWLATHFRMKLVDSPLQVEQMVLPLSESAASFSSLAVPVGRGRGGDWVPSLSRWRESASRGWRSARCGPFTSAALCSSGPPCGAIALLA